MFPGSSKWIRDASGTAARAAPAPAAAPSTIPRNAATAPARADWRASPPARPKSKPQSRRPSAPWPIPRSGSSRGGPLLRRAGNRKVEPPMLNCRVLGFEGVERGSRSAARKRVLPLRRLLKPRNGPRRSAVAGAAGNAGGNCRAARIGAGSFGRRNRGRSRVVPSDQVPRICGFGQRS